MKPILSLGLGLLALLLVLNMAMPTGIEAAQRATSTPRRTATPAVTTYYVTAAANGRECPEITCDVIEKYVAGEAVEVLDEVEGDTVRGSDLWYEVKVSRTRSVFVHSSLLTSRKPVPRATTRGGSAAATPVPGATSLPTEAPAAWSCAGDIYNCGDFATWNEANAYFQACPGDPSRLDNNNDGSPCDSMR